MRALGPLVLAVGLSAALGACASGSAERARREAEVAALRGQLDEVKKGQDAEARERAKLAGELKALDAQQAFLASEAKASKEELARAQQVIERSDGALRELRAAVDEVQRKMAELPPAGKAVTSSAPRETPPDQLYATAMASFRAEEHGQAVLEFTELVERFPQHALASNAQYWIGDAYYRQRDFRQALTEFQKVVDGYPQSPQVPEALLKIGLCHRALKEPAGARESWEQLAKAYPGTTAANQARLFLSQLAGQGRGAR